MALDDVTGLTRHHARPTAIQPGSDLSSLRSFFRDLPLGVALITGPDATVDYANLRLRALLGQEHLAGTGLFDILSERTDQSAVSAIRQVLTGDISSARTIVSLVRGDGTWVPMLLVVVSLQGSSAHRFSGLGYFIDQTEQERQQHRAS